MEDVLLKCELFHPSYVQEKSVGLIQDKWADKIPTMQKSQYYVQFNSEITTALYLKAK